MSRVATVLDVARWEFMRYLKPRQQLVGLLVAVGAGLAAFGALRLADRTSQARVALIPTPGMALGELRTESLVLEVRDEASLPVLLDSVRAGELDGVLRVLGPDRAELTADGGGDWVEEVRAHLSAARQAEMLRRTGLDAATLARVLEPPALDVRSPETGEVAEHDTPRWALVVALSGMILGLMTGMGYLFASITGEKQVRVTEQILSAIPAQPWIDGKILGLAGVTAVSVLNTVFGVVVVMLVLLGDASVLTGFGGGDPGKATLILAFGLVGFFFWFCFLAAVAALIDDPQTSQRNVFMMLPLLFTGLGFLVLRNPDGGLSRVLALLPPSAPGAMPVRIVLGSPAPWEVALSLLLLTAGALLLRRAAGRIFRLAMLMYGKEPTWREVRRWVATP